MASFMLHIAKIVQYLIGSAIRLGRSVGRCMRYMIPCHLHLSYSISVMELQVRLSNHALKDSGIERKSRIKIYMLIILIRYESLAYVLLYYNRICICKKE